MVRTKKVKSAEEEVKEGEEGTAEESAEEAGADAPEAKSSDVSQVTFHIRNANSRNGQSVRVFSKLEHGDGFMEIAKLFEEANTLKKPVNMTDAVEVSACVEHNKNIKHSILSRLDE